MTAFHRWTFAGALLACWGKQCASGQAAQTPRYLLNADAVAGALHSDGVDVQPNEVHLPMPLSALVEHPGLELVGSDRLPDGRMRMRLRCKKAGECVAFSVTIDHALSVPVPHANALSVAALGPVPGSLAVASLPRAEAQIPALVGAATTPPLLFAAGAKLTLLMEQGHMHIHLPVVALESASAGAETRVSTPDRKQTFRVVVVDATTVQGMVP